MQFTPVLALYDPVGVDVLLSLDITHSEFTNVGKVYFRQLSKFRYSERQMSILQTKSKFQYIRTLLLLQYAVKCQYLRVAYYLVCELFFASFSLYGLNTKKAIVYEMQATY